MPAYIECAPHLTTLHPSTPVLKGLKAGKKTLAGVCQHATCAIDRYVYKQYARRGHLPVVATLHAGDGPVYQRPRFLRITDNCTPFSRRLGMDNNQLRGITGHVAIRTGLNVARPSSSCGGGAAQLAALLDGDCLLGRPRGAALALHLVHHVHALQHCAAAAIVLGCRACRTSRSLLFPSAY